MAVGGVAIFPNFPDNFRTRLAVQLPLYTGGRLRRAVDSADLERQASARDVEAGRGDLVLEVATAYWTLATLSRTEEVLSEGLGSYDAHLKDARNREAVGLAARNEVLAVQVERDRAELSLARARAGTSQIAEAQLRRLLDRPADVRIEAAEPLEAPSPADADASALAAAALEARLERAALVARVAAADARVRAEKGARLPEIWAPPASTTRTRTG